MSILHGSPFRTCRFCGISDWVVREGKRELVSYSTRHYAHWWCLMEKKGEAFAKEHVPQWEQRDVQKLPPERQLSHAQRALMRALANAAGNRGVRYKDAYEKHGCSMEEISALEGRFLITQRGRGRNVGLFLADDGMKLLTRWVV